MTRTADEARLAAFRVLEDVRAGAFADHAAARRFASLRGLDRGLAMDMAFGCIRLRARLDHELAAVSDRALSRVEPGVHDWLRLGLYQLGEMRVPPHAAVDETVRGVRATLGPRATGFVNGVLRSAARIEDRAGLFPDPDGDPLGHLTTWGSHPEWLVRRWLGRMATSDVARLVEFDNRAPPVTARLLADDVTGAGRRAREEDLEIEALEPWPHVVRLVRGEPASLLAKVPAVIQDPAASAVVDYLGIPGEGVFLDLCSAPGGKAVAIAAARPRGDGPSVAADVHRARLGSVVRAARRTGVPLRAVAMDGRRPAVRAARTVLADVPCTGTGTLRRRPDARWRIGPARLEALAALQASLMEACADLVAPGGLLVYATCSLEPEENEERVTDFLERHDEFAREPASPDAGLPADAVDADGQLRVLPWRFGTDGSFAARLRRRGG
ncbi:MAG: transcription antitermination factor NusB [Candidatus Palauibacterales bacterium]|nr:transcription antitermination factor NusB [Candidatus Palauibacterales bacterium]MDP2528243.1 transcription antitermination factor NusB [Candidatus Palauibacterales bacterium]MDP2584903.1 transcription antitermination factor NusB [Candidatus Palauibacterales bacterium]